MIELFVADILFSSYVRNSIALNLTAFNSSRKVALVFANQNPFKAAFCQASCGASEAHGIQGKLSPFVSFVQSVYMRNVYIVFKLTTRAFARWKDLDLEPKNVS